MQISIIFVKKNLKINMWKRKILVKLEIVAIIQGNIEVLRVAYVIQHIVYLWKIYEKFCTYENFLSKSLINNALRTFFWYFIIVKICIYLSIIRCYSSVKTFLLYTGSLSNSFWCYFRLFLKFHYFLK